MHRNQNLKKKTGAALDFPTDKRDGMFQPTQYAPVYVCGMCVCVYRFSLFACGSSAFALPQAMPNNTKNGTFMRAITDRPTSLPTATLARWLGRGNKFFFVRKEGGRLCQGTARRGKVSARMGFEK